MDKKTILEIVILELLVGAASSTLLQSQIMLLGYPVPFHGVGLVLGGLTLMIVTMALWMDREAAQ